MRVCILLTVFAALIVPTRAVAQRDTTRIIRLDSLRVDVTRAGDALARVPAAISVVDGADLGGARPRIGLDESLGVVPGVIVDNRQNFSLGTRVAIRGLGLRTAFGVRGVRIISDGIPLTMPDGQTSLTNLDLLSSGSIEVLRGPASAMWGNGAGGVIFSRTALPADAGMGAEVSTVVSDLGSGSDDPTNLRRHALRVSGADGTVVWTASASRLDQRGFRSHSRAAVSQFNGVARIDLGNARSLTFVLNGVDMPEALNPGSLPADTAAERPSAAWPNNVRTGSGERTRQVQTGVSAALPALGGELDVAAHAVTRSLENPLPFGYIELDRRAGGMRAAWNGPLSQSRRLDAGAGIDIEAQRDERREFANDGGLPSGPARRDQIDRVTTVAPFARLRFQASREFALSAGGRIDRVQFAVDDAMLEDGRDDSGERSLGAASAFAGVLWEPRSDIGTWLNVGTSFQTPTTTELINRPPGAGETCCPGGFDPELDPQRARSIEAGMRLNQAGLALELAAYTMSVDDAIVPFQVAEVEDRNFFRNAARTRHRGIEAGATAQRGDTRARLAYTWSRFIFIDDGFAAQDFEGNRVPGAPEHRLAIRIQQVFGPVTAELGGDHRGAYFVDDANTIENDGATTLDVRAYGRARLGQMAVEPFVAIINLGDARYNGSVVANAVGGRYYEPAPGRHLLLGLTLRTGPANR